MNNWINFATATVLGIIGLAIVSVIIGQRSQAPAAIQATGSALANVVAAAVNPATLTPNNGNNAQSFTTPTVTPKASSAFDPLGFATSVGQFMSQQIAGFTPGDVSNFFGVPSQ